MAGPAFRAAAVRVRVPATSANLGPGFDAFGLSLGLYDDVVVRVADAGLHVDIAGEGAETLPATRTTCSYGPCAPPSTCSAASRAAWRSSAPTASRTAAAWAPPPPRSAPGSSPRAP